MSDLTATAMEQVVLGGDLSVLSPTDRLAYYVKVCQSLGLNPLTKPFEYIVLNDKLTLYARRDATDQLRKLHGISVTIVAREKVDDVYVVTARATSGERSDESIGAVALSKEDGEWASSQNGKRYFKKNGQQIPLRGDDLGNAFMKAETKAKRRVTLSLVGLGILDETEIETIPDARRVQVNGATGEIVEPAKLPPARTVPHEAEPTNGNGKPGKSQRRIDLEKRYGDIYGQLKARGLEAEHTNAEWSDDVLIEKGKDGAKRLHADLDKEFSKASGG